MGAHFVGEHFNVKKSYLCIENSFFFVLKRKKEKPPKKHCNRFDNV